MSYRLPPYVRHRSVHDEIVLLDTRTDDYLGLNPTAAVAWQVLVDGGTVEAAAADLTARFEVAPRDALGDATAFAEQMVERGLLQRC